MKFGRDSFSLDNGAALLNFFYFGVADKLSGDVWSSVPFDALIGMSNKPSGTRAYSFLQALKDANEIAEESFSLYTNYKLGTGHLILGGIDPNIRPTNTFTYHSISTSSSSWKMSITGIQVKGPSGDIIQSISLSGGIAIIDSGTSGIIVTESIYSQLSSSLVAVNNGFIGNSIEISARDSTTNEVVSYKVDDSDKTNLFLYNSATGKREPQVYSQGSSISGSTNAVILGEAFLALFYTHFDHQNYRVGFSFTG